MQANNKEQREGAWSLVILLLIVSLTNPDLVSFFVGFWNLQYTSLKAIKKQTNKHLITEVEGDSYSIAVLLTRRVHGLTLSIWLI